MARCLTNSKTAEAKQIPAPPSACPCSLPPTALHSTKAEKEINTEVPAEPRWETLGVRELGENPDSSLSALSVASQYPARQLTLFQQPQEKCFPNT